jgi:hypothetical protein
VNNINKINPLNNLPYYEYESLVYFIDEEDRLPYPLNSGIGKVVAANGISFEITFQIKQSYDETESYTGKTYIIPGSGTGKFEGCSGSFDCVGAVDYTKGGTWFKLDGYLVYD